MWQALAIVGLVFVAVVAVEYVEIERLRTEIAQRDEQIAADASAAKTQSAEADAVNAKNEAKTHDIQSTLDSTLAAHAATSDALADRVRQYSALERRCAVPKTTASPVGAVRHDSAQQAASGPGPIDQALAALVQDAQPVIDQARACTQWVKP